MIVTELANTGVFIPEIGIGTWNYHAGSAPLRKGLEAGALFIDTAESYGTESAVGEAVRGMRNRVFIASKVSPQNFHRTELRKSVDTSLRTMGVDIIDLLQLHEPNPSIPITETMGAMAELVDAGKIRFVGVSNFSVEQLERTLTLQEELRVARFKSVQNVLNYAVRAVDGPMRDLCSRWNVAIVTYSPLGAGFLTGKHEHGVEPGSRFAIIPGHQDVYFNDLARQRLRRLQSVATRAGVSVVELALAWALHQPQVATVLVGGRSPAHLDQALRARSFHAPDLWRELDEGQAQ